MAFPFHLPDIGEGVIEGEVVSWKVAEGELVKLDQDMVEIMTDKATVMIPAPRAGIIAKIYFAEGEICPVGDILVVIDDQTENQGASPMQQQAGTTLPQRESQLEVNGRTSSHIATHRAPMGQRILATPATRRLARRLGVNLAQVSGTGKRGRVTSEDIRRQSGDNGVVTQPAPVVSGVPHAKDCQGVSAEAGVGTEIVETRAQNLPARVHHEDEERIPLRGLRRRIADQMTRSKFTAPHFTYVEEIDATPLVELRSRAKIRAQERGVKLTYLAFIVKAVVAGLRRWPQLNAVLDEQAQEIVYKRYYHIGIAAQGPGGLLVPVIRDADRRSIFDIAVEIERLAHAVEDGSIDRQDLVGSTFTITSLGKLGGVLATPIINHPEVGILGVHKLDERPVVVDGEIVVRSMMNLSISLDHRVVDGFDGAMYLQYVKSLLEDPDMMFMETI